MMSGYVQSPLGNSSTAKIAVRKVIPAMQRGMWSEVTAIASRDRSKAEDAARTLGIAKSDGSYDELLADPDIEAIYNPLPNQLHVPWSIKAAEAGKHVLCEKPLSLTVAEVKKLLAVRDRMAVKIGEAFMVRTHPQWLRARELVASGRIGQLRSALGFFTISTTTHRTSATFPNTVEAPSWTSDATQSTRRGSCSAKSLRVSWVYWRETRR